MLNEEEQRQTVLQELLAGKDQFVDRPEASRGAPARASRPPRPARWPAMLALGALSAQAELGLTLLTMSAGRSAHALSRPLAYAFLCLVPPAMLCGLLAILLVRLHGTAWVLLVGVLTLPLNVYVGLVLCGVVPCPLSS
jgi:hypothetical protein